MNAVIAPRPAGRMHPLTRTIYTARSLGLLMFGAVLALYFSGGPTPGWVWALLAFYTLAWPQLVLWVSLRSTSVEPGERLALMVDAFAAGGWSALLGFDAAACAVFVSAVVMNSAGVGGIRLVLRSVPALALGAVAGAAAMPPSQAWPMSSATAALLAVMQVVYVAFYCHLAWRNMNKLIEARRVIRQQAAELEVARAAAEASSEAKSAFLAAMSHEIRTPMNGVIGMSSLLLDTPLSPEQREHAQTVRDSAEALVTVINDILDFSKIEAGRLAIESAPLRPRDVVQACTDLLRYRAAENRVQVQVAIAPDVPEAVLGDVTRLRQVLLNLLANAVKFSPGGEVRLTVEARAGGQLAFAVQDTGIGLSAEGLARLFQPYAQAEGSTAREYGGTGLGLVISKTLVELMGGSLSAESAGPGQGSLFRFDIRAPVCDAAAVEAPEVARPDPSLAARHPLRVLLAEDNAVNQKLALRLLQQMGYSAEVAGNGQEALAAVQRQPFDLLLMDVQMPELDGMAATRRILERCGAARPRIVAMTANAMQGDREACLAAGMDDYITKPVRVDALMRILQTTKARS
jgi:signal transduction histidine kinase/ActR/RegA family two-component response regulator